MFQPRLCLLEQRQPVEQTLLLGNARFQLFARLIAAAASLVQRNAHLPSEDANAGGDDDGSASERECLWNPGVNGGSGRTAAHGADRCIHANIERSKRGAATPGE